MRDFTTDHSALALNTASLGHNLDGHGAGWSPERVIDACAERGFGSIVFWRREIGSRAQRRLTCASKTSPCAGVSTCSGKAIICPRPRPLAASIRMRASA